MNEVYAFQNTADEVMKSSSGGAFIALCRAFEKEYGAGNVAFYGVVCDNEMNVRHTCVFSSEQCNAFQGSKYVRSRCNFSELRIRENIRQGKHILFSGTPCQIHALNKYIKKFELPSQMILTIDVICHGAPRAEFWNAYKSWLEDKYKSRLIEYSFRYKPEGWKAYPAYARFANGKKVINTADTSVYSRIYMERYNIGKGCFLCPFSREERVSDITLGDYWGIDRIFQNLDYKKGVSLMIVHSEHADTLIKVLEGSEDIFLKKTSDKTYLKYQHNLNRPTECPDKYDAFWSDFNQLPFKKLLAKYIGYGYRYKLIYAMKKNVRKTPLIEWYRSR